MGIPIASGSSPSHGMITMGPSSSIHAAQQHLHLAASTMESTVVNALLQLLQSGEAFDYAAVKELAQPQERSVPDLRLRTPNLGDYDQLLEGRA